MLKLPFRLSSQPLMARDVPKEEDNDKLVGSTILINADHRDKYKGF